MGQQIRSSTGREWFQVAQNMDATNDITVYKSNWDRNAWDHLQQCQPLRLHVFGPDALVFSETLRPAVGADIPWTGITEIDRAMAEAERRRRRRRGDGGSGGEAYRTNLSDDALIAAFVAARLLGGATQLAVLALCLHAVDRGYDVEFELNEKGPMPWEQELVYHLTPKQ